jgi:uncharacterized protein (UPF0371 family)
MGVNMAKIGIINDEVCREAGIREIKRRYKFYKKEYEKGRENKGTIERMEEIIKKLN